MCAERRLPSRRKVLERSALGFGALAFALLEGRPRAQGTTLFPRKLARRVVFLYMDGGVSQMDSFDPKPRLEKELGQPIGMAIPKTQFADVGKVLKCPWEFAQHGQ